MNRCVDSIGLLHFLSPSVLMGVNLLIKLFLCRKSYCDLSLQSDSSLLALNTLRRFPLCVPRMMLELKSVLNLPKHKKNLLTVVLA